MLLHAGHGEETRERPGRQLEIVAAMLDREVWIPFSARIVLQDFAGCLVGHRRSSRLRQRAGKRRTRAFRRSDDQHKYELVARTLRVKVKRAAFATLSYTYDLWLNPGLRGHRSSARFRRHMHSLGEFGSVTFPNRGAKTMAYSERDVLVTGLKNAYALESQAADITENQANRLSDYPELQKESRVS